MRTNLLIDANVEQEMRISNYFRNLKIFIVIDESEINGKKYFNILAGLIKAPLKNFLIDCTKLEFDQSMNSDLVLRFVSDALNKYDRGFDQLSLILSDSARYMIIFDHITS